jgi:two-component system, OmpR family, alkaline phosphatase synthesis response regulator PhoP
MAKILLVEDDKHLRYGIRFNLEREGHEVSEAESGEDGLEAARTQGPDLVLLDVMLPGISGMQVLETLRHEGFGNPILILTARSDESDAVTALSLGADDYIRKPFGVSELAARITAILRRIGSGGATEQLAPPLGPWTIDIANFRARSSEGEVALTSLEAEILATLLQHRGDVVSREDLLAQVWGIGSKTPTRTLDNHVARLRKKIEEDPSEPTLILTVYGVGYKVR